MEPVGVIAVIQGDMSRWADFDRWLVELKRPDDILYLWARGLNIAEGRNEAANAMLKSGAQWIWFLDDDMSSPNTNCLNDLIARDVDIVQPLSLNRKTLQYNAFTGYDGEGFIAWEGKSQTTGLLPVVACGCGGTLIKRRVFEAFEPPFFRLGTFKPDVVSEDLYFTSTAVRKGFKAFVDLDNKMSHFTGCSLEVDLKDGELVKAVKLTFHKLLAQGI